MIHFFFLESHALLVQYPKKVDAALAWFTFIFFLLFLTKNQGKNHDRKGDSSKKIPFSNFSFNIGSFLSPII